MKKTPQKSNFQSARAPINYPCRSLVREEQKTHAKSANQVSHKRKQKQPIFRTKRLKRPKIRNEYLLPPVDIELPYEPQAINNPEISFLAAIGPLTSFFLCCYTRIQLDCPFAFLLFRLGPAFAGNLSSTGLLNSAFFLFAVVGLQIVNNPVKQILDIKP